MKKLLIGFLLVTEHADPRRDCACIENEDAVLLFFTVNSYAQGEQYAKVLAALGCVGIELCPGFGNEGVARIQKAVGPHTPVGVVRFDIHPALDHRSGDSFPYSRPRKRRRCYP